MLNSRLQSLLHKIVKHKPELRILASQILFDSSNLYKIRRYVNPQLLATLTVQETNLLFQ